MEPIRGMHILMTTSNNVSYIHQHSQALHLVRLLQLCSANLPVGGFSFSQGLEYAVEKGWVIDPESTYDWVKLNLTESLAYNDIAVIKRLFESLDSQKHDDFLDWNSLLIASRESAELRMADLAMGKALIRLLRQLNELDLSAYSILVELDEMSFTAAFAWAAWLWKIDLNACQSGFCWSYIDQQVAAATKLVPLGQTQSQNLLFSLSQSIDSVLASANGLGDHDLGSSLPRLAMASAWHENQYTRLFRS